MIIDVKEVLKSKKPSLAKWTPSFLTNYLERVIHQDEVNRYLTTFSHLDSIGFTRATLAEMGISSHTVGLDRIDPSGRYIFASNHPFGGLDGLMLADHIEKHFGDVRVIVNDLLMNLEPLKSIFIPINKHGRQTTDYLKKYNETFTSNIPVVTFPAGLCSRKKNGVISDNEWKSNFVKKAIKTERDVIPVYFEGRLSDFFYRLSNIRSAIGIKANIEMLYLADEMFRQGGQDFRILFGQPVPWQELRDSGNPRMAAEIMRTKTYNLKKLVHE